MTEVLTLLLPVAVLAGTIMFMFRGTSAHRRGRTPGWLAPPKHSVGSAFLLDGIIAAAALSQVLTAQNVAIGADVAGIVLGIATVLAMRFEPIEDLVALVFGIVGVAASVPTLLDLVSTSPTCPTAAPAAQRLIVVTVLAIGYLSITFLTFILIWPFRRRMLRRYGRIGLGLYAATEFVVALTLLGSMGNTRLSNVLIMVLGAAVVGALTPLFPELTIWTMGVALVLYTFIGGSLANYSDEPAVRACLGQAINFGVLLGFGLAVLIGWIVLRMVRSKR